MESEEKKRGYHVPPCVRLGVPMNYCTQARYAEQILGHLNLFGDWRDWKFKGNELVSPDGLRVRPERLRGMLFRENIRRKTKTVVSGEAKASGEAAKVIPLVLLTQQR